MDIPDIFISLATGASVILVAAIFIWLALRLSDRIYPEAVEADDEHYRFKRQVTKVVIIAIGLVLILILLPISDSTRGQLFSLLGLVITAMIALGSTSFVSNAMAGIMLRSVDSFRPGDFVRVGDHSGRVSDRGLFHTEIQTEDRDLTTLPNLFLVQQPVTVIRNSGTITSASVSLGYDVPHSLAKEKLLEATVNAELKDGFVRISELLDHAVLYKVYGFLGDTKKILLARSRLREEILSSLHKANIEITSPSHMVQRRLVDIENTVPDSQHESAHDSTSEVSAEELIFDKADLAEKTETLKARRDAVNTELQGLQKVTDPEKQSDPIAISKLQRQLERLDTLLAKRAAKIKEER